MTKLRYTDEVIDDLLPVEPLYIAVLFLIFVCGFGYCQEVCQRQNIKVSYVCYGVSLKVKGCGNVDGNGH